ncbi:phage tail protein [Anaeromusa acidaminophila]|uniref:phage tail protein n=1 Tax=Anaeromusa acidaminophila TaxID=81464 RepID=UPI00146BBBFF|nr:phage tail protein [Anaeromusa acidaminophila]
MPVGTVIWFAAATPPTGYLECNGQSTGSYSLLASVVGPNVPDLRGKFIRGWSHEGIIDSGRIFGTLQQDALQNIQGSFDGISSIYNYWSYSSKTGAFSNSPAPFAGSYLAYGGSAANLTITFDASLSARTANETRPTNIALLPCIKY